MRAGTPNKSERNNSHSTLAQKRLTYDQYLLVFPFLFVIRSDHIFARAKIIVFYVTYEYVIDIQYTYLCWSEIHLQRTADYLISEFTYVSPSLPDVNCTELLQV